MRLWSVLLWSVMVLFTGPGSAENVERELAADMNLTFFISEIFEKYGNNNIMTYEGFEHLLENLGLGKLKFDTKHDVSIHKVNGTFRDFHDELFLHKHDHNASEPGQTPTDDSARQKRNLQVENSDLESLKRKCLSPQDILTTYGLKPYHEVVISPAKYLQICPAIVYELDRKLCQVEEAAEGGRKEEERRLVWMCATGSVVAMGLSGMACVLAVPWLKKERFSGVVEFLVSLAVGTLCGDAMIHLVPQVFRGNGTAELEVKAISKGTLALMAVYFFFIVENLLKGARNKTKGSGEGGGRQWNTAVNPDDSKESGPMIPSAGHGHGHSHSHAKGEIKTVAWMAIMGDILHNVTDGLSIGAAFSASLASGFASSIAIFCHELPHELGDYAILIASGMSVKKALLFNVLSSVFSFAGLMLAVLLGELKDATSWINAFTAGSFLYIALSDLVPEMKSMQENSTCRSFVVQTTGLCFGGILMLAIALYENQLESLLC